MPLKRDARKAHFDRLSGNPAAVPSAAVGEAGRPLASRWAPKE